MSRTVKTPNYDCSLSECSCVSQFSELLKKLSVAMKKQRDARTELEKQKQKDTTFVNKKKDYEQLKKELAVVDEGIARLQCSGQDDDRLALPVQDLVRNSPRRQSLPAVPISRYPPASPRTPSDGSMNGVSRRGRAPPAPATAPVERKRRRVT
uniref:Structural maintenance n=1 Tax=Rhipicephalus appendiculatus TaxID=34631 RepID=A0A131YSW8_RHIAP